MGKIISVKSFHKALDKKHRSTEDFHRLSMHFYINQR